MEILIDIEKGIYNINLNYLILLIGMYLYEDKILKAISIIQKSITDR